MADLSWQLTPYSVPIILAGSVTFICGALLWRGESVRSRYAALLLFTLSVWLIGYAMELTATRLPAKVFAKNMQLGAGTFIPVPWFALVTTYSGYGRWLSAWALLPLSLPTLATVALMTTNRYHRFVAHGLALDSSGPFVLLDRSWGPWFYFAVAYAYLLLGPRRVITPSISQKNIPQRYG